MTIYRLSVLKKLIITFLCSYFCILELSAESHYVPHISIGAHGGAMISKVSFSPSIPQKWQMGPTFGVSLRYAEERLVGIRAELNFTQRGWSEDFEESPLSYIRSLQYISLPIMTHIYFGSSRCKCFFNLGPEFSFLLGQSTSSNFDYTNPTADKDWPIDKRMTEQLTTEVKNKFDYGICVGVGCEYYLKPRNSIYIEFRYYYGLGNIFPSSKADTFGASRNMSVAATLGYNFRIK